MLNKKKSIAFEAKSKNKNFLKTIFLNFKSKTKQKKNKTTTRKQQKR